MTDNDGGKKCGDTRQIDKIRSTGKEMLKDIGMKIITGQFSLTKISFPIKAMVPRTSLETATYGSTIEFIQVVYSHCTWDWPIGLLTLWRK
jgi:hypothetical protein